MDRLTEMTMRSETETRVENIFGNTSRNTPDTVKLGLALSGGGFRSAFFHVGILARLSELDLLRKVDVISSVSGGSIIAAYYYLKVKALLEKPRAPEASAPSREDYMRLVSEIEREFLTAVQKNMLLRTFLDPQKNARMLADDMTSTERLAELLTRYFFQPIFKPQDPDAVSSQIPLRHIAIRPSAPLGPETRVPALIINATSMNTGHLWQFTAESVGEQPSIHEIRHESLAFLEKFRLDDERLTMEQRKILYPLTLGQAVAASCCVPGIFGPLQIRNLYRSGGKPLTVRLVDGGLVDNQGLASLFAENCSHIICSDASDILKFDPHPPVRFLDAALRANDILMDRIRGKSLKELFSYGDGRFALFDMGDPDTRADIFPDDSEKIVQALTRIRTDLDSFTDREADILMYYGYQLSRREMETQRFDLIRQPSPATRNWRFLAVRERFLKSAQGRAELLFHLDVGSRQMFKVFLMGKAMPYVIVLPVPVILALVILFLMVRISPMVFWGLLIGAGLVLIYTQNQRIIKLMDNVTALKRIKRRILSTLISLRLPEPFSYMMALGFWVQVTVFDRLFLYYGRVRDQAAPPVVRWVRNFKRSAENK